MKRVWFKRKGLFVLPFVWQGWVLTFLIIFLFSLGLEWYGVPIGDRPPNSFFLWLDSFVIWTVVLYFGMVLVLAVVLKDKENGK